MFEDDTKLQSDFTMFIPAGDGHEVIKTSDLTLNDAGFVKINDYCEAVGYEEQNYREFPECRRQAA